MKINDEMAPSDPGFHTLCPTRWTVRADSLASVRINYAVLNQPGYAVYSNLEKLLVNAVTGKCFDAEFEAVMKVYSIDFDSSLLKTQLGMYLAVKTKI